MLCTVCKKYPPVKGRVRCISCIDSADKRSSKYTKKRVAEGKCAICGVADLHSGIRCVLCAEKHQARAKARRAEYTAKGLCYQCGKRPHRPERRTCTLCGIDPRRNKK